VLVNVDGQMGQLAMLKMIYINLEKQNVKFKQVSVIVIFVTFQLTQLNYGIAN
jgi:hypothetical protein